MTRSVVCPATTPARAAAIPAPAIMTPKPLSFALVANSATFSGVDALLSTVMMPSGIPVATVAIDGSKNAAYLAAQILAISDEELAKKVLENRQKQSAAVLVKDQEIQEKVQAL